MEGIFLMEEQFRRLIPLVMLMCEVLETKGTTNLPRNLPFHEAMRVIYFQFVLLQSSGGADVWSLPESGPSERNWPRRPPARSSH